MFDRVAFSKIKFKRKHNFLGLPFISDNVIINKIQSRLQPHFFEYVREIENEFYSN